VLNVLRERDDFVSGSEIAEALSISRNAVWKHIETLKAGGYRIESLHSRGYRLLSAPDRLTEEELAAHLGTSWLGRSLACHEVTGSTNSDAAELGRGGAPEGAVVVADAQTAGRGRLGRSWVSEPGLNLYLSVLLRPEILPFEAPQLSLVAGVAVAAALESLGARPRIKWPNDVLLDGRKVCGILTEIEAEADRVSFVVVGLGVNLNSRLHDFPEELHDKATSLRIESGETVERAPVAARVLGELERFYDLFRGGGFGAVAPEWERRTALVGRELTVSGAGEVVSGTYAGVDTDGALLLDAPGSSGGPGGVRRVLAGDVTVVGGYDDTAARSGEN
jgi:BirA family biotin operon repressor/biotin-[acetyl-CoA-carboxylase] ligase